MIRPQLLALAALVLVTPALAQVNDDAKAVLAESAKAIKDVTGLQYEAKTYATGMLKDIIDLSGTVKIWRPEGSTSLMWRVDGRAKDPGKPDRQLHAVSDGNTITWLRYTDNARVTAPASEPDAMEVANMCRELIPQEWISATPYTFELTQFPNLAKTGLANVDGQVCEVIDAAPAAKNRNRTWSIGVKDHLPRSLELGTGALAPKIAKITEMTAMKTAKFTQADFDIALPVGFEPRVISPATPHHADTQPQASKVSTVAPATPSAAPIPSAVAIPASGASTSPAPVVASPADSPRRATLGASHVEIRFEPVADPEFPDPTNAALLYNRAFMLLPDDTIKKLGEIITPDNPNWLPDADLTQKLIDSDNVASTLMRAAKMDSADFGVEYSQGIGALLPHLSKMRSAARFLAADSRRLLQAQKPDDAADRIAAMFGMARHLSRDRLLISALVSSAIHAVACAQTDYLINSAQLTTSAKARILAAMDTFAVPDPFGIKAAVRGERYWVVVWLRAQVAGPDGIKVFLEQMLPAIGDQPSDADLKALKSMDAAAITADLDKSDRYYSSVLEVFDLPDAETRLATLEKGVKNNEFGLIARYAAPAMTRAHQQDVKAHARQTDARARLENAYARPS